MSRQWLRNGRGRLFKVWIAEDSSLNIELPMASGEFDLFSFGMWVAHLRNRIIGRRSASIFDPGCSIVSLEAFYLLVLGQCRPLALPQPLLLRL